MKDNYHHRLKLLTYNIQTGAHTKRYHHYLTHGWKHILPIRERNINLNSIANVIRDYDVVGLQEVDSGSLRTGFLDQTEYLAIRGGFPYWYKQINRRLGGLAQQSNGLLSRIKPSYIDEYKLPGLPGRGVILCRYGGDSGLTICILHLALGRRARLRQIRFVCDLISSLPHVVIMGDLNCGTNSPEMQLLVDCGNLRESICNENTFPSWRPMRKIDHILVSETLVAENPRVLNSPLSDHLAIGIDVLFPNKLKLSPS